MLTQLLRSTRRALRGKALRKPLEALGIIALGRAIYLKRLIRQGEHSATLMGVPLRFAVSSEREIARIDAGYLEEEFVTRLINCLRPGDVVYDIGANIGMVTLLVAGHAKKAGVPIHIHAFEPEPRNFDHLKRNTQLNALGTVTCHRIALAAADSTGQLFIDGEAGTGTHSILAQSAHGRASIPITLRNGADYAREINAPPTVLKIDVEGAEMEVLEGLRPLLESRTIREILVEVHPTALEAAGRGADAVSRFLTSLGYTQAWRSARGEEVHEHYVSSSDKEQPKAEHSVAERMHRGTERIAFLLPPCNRRDLCVRPSLRQRTNEKPPAVQGVWKCVVTEELTPPSSHP